MTSESLEQLVMQQLATVDDPELHQDLVSLNMIRDLTINGSTAEFTVVLTTPACPLKDKILADVTEAVTRVDGIDAAKVKWDAQVVANPRVMGRLQIDVKHIIAVSSGKGGVGKSTVSANLAIALAEMGATVGLLDADITGPNIPMLMGVDRMPPPKGQRLVPAENYGVQVMSMGFLVEKDKPLIWRGPMVHGAIRQFFTDVEWYAMDYLVIDLPPGTGDAQLTLAQSVPLTGAVIVTQPQEVAVGDALRGLAMFEQVNVPILGVIENMRGEFFGSGGGETLAETRNVPFLGSIPLDPQVRIGGDNGQPIVISAPDSPAAAAFRNVAQAIAARSSVLAFQNGGNVIPLTTIS